MDTYVAAVITDIHGNLEALNAILEDIELKKEEMFKRDIDIPFWGIIFLGDGVGYGPNQLECLDILRKKARVYLPGNHEEMLRLMLLHPGITLPGVHPIAKKALEHTVNQLIGEVEIKELKELGKTYKIPATTLEELQKKDYHIKLAKTLVEQIKDNVKVDPPESGLFSKKCTDEDHKQIVEDVLLDSLTEYSGLYEAYKKGLERRERTLSIYNFLEEIREHKVHRLKNAIFVHDDPVNPGSAEYLVDDETAKKIPITSGRVSLKKINKRRFKNIDFFFLGHTHAKAATKEHNTMTMVYCGSGIPRLDNPERETGYVMCVVDKQIVANAFPIPVEYPWQTTQRKNKEIGLHDHFGTR